MSADNYGVIDRRDDKFVLLQGFASSESNPTEVFSSTSFAEVVEKANEWFFEYGWSYSLALEGQIINSLES